MPDFTDEESKVIAGLEKTMDDLDQWSRELLLLLAGIPIWNGA